MVEPMRTEAEHQGRGLAQYPLNQRHRPTGPGRSDAHQGTRIKVCFEWDNSAARHLYLSTGFEPDRANDVLTGPTVPDPVPR